MATQFRIHVFVSHYDVCLYLCYFAKSVRTLHELVVLLAGDLLGILRRESGRALAIDLYHLNYSFCLFPGNLFLLVCIIFLLKRLCASRFNRFHEL